MGRLVKGPGSETGDINLHGALKDGGERKDGDTLEQAIMLPDRRPRIDGGRGRVAGRGHGHDRDLPGVGVS